MPERYTLRVRAVMHPNKRIIASIWIARANSSTLPSMVGSLNLDLFSWKALKHLLEGGARLERFSPILKQSLTESIHVSYTKDGECLDCGEVDSHLDGCPIAEMERALPYLEGRWLKVNLKIEEEL